MAAIIDYRMWRASEDWLPPLPVRPERGRARIVLEETATLIAAAARGPRAWLTAIPWLRARRELAYGLDGGEPRRHAPDPETLAVTGRGLRAVLAVAATLLVAGAAAGATAAVPASPPSSRACWTASGRGGTACPSSSRRPPCSASPRCSRSGAWASCPRSAFSSASAIAEHGQGLADLIRDPRKAVRDFIRDMTPGEALAYALGLVLERVLRGLGKRFADRFGPRNATDDPAEDAAPAPKGPKPGSIEYDANEFRKNAQKTGTSKLTHNLRESMRDPVTGKLPPKPSGTAAHHIVPRGMYLKRGTAARAFLEQAQAKLQRLGINADDAANGVFYDTGPHARIHTDYYFERLAEELSEARTKAEGEDILAAIAEEIVDGTFP